MAVTHRSLSVAVESSFGSIDSSTGAPSATGLSFISIPCERDPIVVPGEAPVSERTEARDGPHGLPPELDTTYIGGVKQQRRTGTVTVRCDFTTLGSGSNYAATALGRLLSAGFSTTIPGAESDAVSAAVSDNRYTPTTLGNYKLGGLIGLEINGRAEYAHVTSENASGTGNIGYSPAFSRALTNSDTVRLLQTWYTAKGTASGAVGSSVAFRIDGVGVRSFAYGCKMESLAISVDGGRLMGDFTFQAAHIEDDPTYVGGPFEPETTNGATPHFRSCYVVVSDGAVTSRTDISGDNGDEKGRVSFDVSELSATITNTLTPVGQTSSLIGMSDMEVSDQTVEINLTLDSANTTISNDFRDAVVRDLLIGTGPVGDGQGMAINIPGAYLTVDPLIRKIDGEIVQQSLTYAASRFGGDAGTGDAGGTPFRIGLGL